MSRSFQQTIHNRVTDTRSGKTFRKDHIHIHIIKITQNSIQMLCNAIFILSAAGAFDHITDIL